MRFVYLARRVLCAAALLLSLGLGILGVAAGSAPGLAQGAATQAGRSPAHVSAATLPALALDSFPTADPPCHDRSVQPHTAIVDTHVDFRPLGGPAVPFEEVVEYFEATSVLFANVYGIDQMLPASSCCRHYLDCPGTPVTPTLKNDFVNAANMVVKTPKSLIRRCRWSSRTSGTWTRSWPGCNSSMRSTRPSSAQGMRSTWSSRPCSITSTNPSRRPPIAEWAGFMELLRDRGIPLVVDAEIGIDDEPTRYLPLTRWSIQSPNPRSQEGAQSIERRIGTVYTRPLPISPKQRHQQRYQEEIPVYQQVRRLTTENTNVYFRFKHECPAAPGTSPPSLPAVADQRDEGVQGIAAGGDAPARRLLMPKGPQGQWRPTDPVARTVHVASITTAEGQEACDAPRRPNPTGEVKTPARHAQNARCGEQDGQPAARAHRRRTQTHGAGHSFAQ